MQSWCFQSTNSEVGAESVKARMRKLVLLNSSDRQHIDTGEHQNLTVSLKGLVNY